MKTDTRKAENKELEVQRSVVRDQKEYVSLLEKLMAFMSHNIRQPIAHVLGLSYLLKTVDDNPVELNKKLMGVKKAALMLDNRTRELSILIYKKIISLKKVEESRCIQKPRAR